MVLNIVSYSQQIATSVAWYFYESSVLLHLDIIHIYADKYSVQRIYRDIFVLSLLNEHLKFFQFVVVINNAAMNVAVGV